MGLTSEQSKNLLHYLALSTDIQFCTCSLSVRRNFFTLVQNDLINGRFIVTDTSERLNLRVSLKYRGHQKVQLSINYPTFMGLSSGMQCSQEMGILPSSRSVKFFGS